MDSAVTLAEEEEVDAIVLLTDTGRTAAHISKFRPHRPIIALTPSKAVARALLLHYGVYPLAINMVEGDDDASMEKGVELAKSCRILGSGQKLLLLRDRANRPEVEKL